MRDAILRLEKNPDYRLVFEEHIFRDEAARTVGCLADPQFASDEAQNHLQKTLSMISVLQLMLMHAVTMGNMATSSIAENEELLEELRAGEDA